MRKTFSILILSTMLLCAAPAISADRVVVIPLGGAKNFCRSISPDGIMSLVKNSSEPYVCDAGHSGAIALTSRFTTCACNGTKWVLTTNNGTANCEWSEIVACNNSHLGLCATSDDCTSAGGYWQSDSTCYSLSDLYQGNECYNIGDGTVVKQGLMWQKSDDGVTRTWTESDAYCSNLILAGYSDWRVPLKHELMGLVVCSDGTPTPLLDYASCGAGAAYPTSASCFSSQNGNYWTAARYDEHQVWGINFSNGQSLPQNVGYNNDDYLYVRCVR